MTDFAAGNLYLYKMIQKMQNMALKRFNCSNFKQTCCFGLEWQL